MTFLTNKKSSAFAPSNIALIKYWGKRDTHFNLPVTDSLSIDLKDKGAKATIRYAQHEDQMTLNDNPVPDSFRKKVCHILNQFRTNSHYYQVDFETNIPVAAGLASSAALFSSLVKALDRFHNTHLSLTELSTLSRQGSGSAARSLWSGFVQWQRGEKTDGSDSHGIPLPYSLPNLCIGILTVSDSSKSIGSTQAMLRTQQQASGYTHWPEQVQNDISQIQAALSKQDFTAVGQIAQRNAEKMHELMHQAGINYDLPESDVIKNQVKALQQAGHALYFTQDAGPNIKLLFMKSTCDLVLGHFPTVDIIQPFNEDDIVLVNRKNQSIGTIPKLIGHQQGKLHRAFSVFICRDTENGLEVLLQQREFDKYHCGGLWTNTCCSHPLPGEDILQAGKRRLQEEMGICAELKEVGQFIYQAEFDNGLIEHEYDHVLIGHTNQQPHPNISEVADFMWISIGQLKIELIQHPEQFTPWLQAAIETALLPH